MKIIKTSIWKEGRDYVELNFFQKDLARPKFSLTDSYFNRINLNKIQNFPIR